MIAAAYSALPRKRYRCVIGANAARCADAIELSTSAFSERDLRNLLLLTFGSQASREAIIVEEVLA